MSNEVESGVEGGNNVASEFTEAEKKHKRTSRAGRGPSKYQIEMNQLPGKRAREQVDYMGGSKDIKDEGDQKKQAKKVKAQPEKKKEKKQKEKKPKKEEVEVKVEKTELSSADKRKQTMERNRSQQVREAIEADRLKAQPPLTAAESAPMGENGALFMMLREMQQDRVAAAAATAALEAKFTAAAATTAAALEAAALEAKATAAAALEAKATAAAAAAPVHRHQNPPHYTPVLHRAGAPEHHVGIDSQASSMRDSQDTYDMRDSQTTHDTYDSGQQLVSYTRIDRSAPPPLFKGFVSRASSYDDSTYNDHEAPR
jgi:hypothetical protein